MIGSLRARLLLGTTVASALILALLAISVHAAVRHALLAEFDESLLAKAKALASMVEQRQSDIKFEFTVRDLPEFNAGVRPHYFELWVDGRPFARSPSLGNGSLGLTAASPAGIVTRTTVLPDGRAGEVVIFPFLAHPEDDEQLPAPRQFGAVVAVARDTEHLEQNLSRLRWMIASLCIAAIAISGGTLLLVITRGLRPVNVLAREIEHTDESALARHFELRGIPAEITPMVQKLNALLDRLHAAFDRERAFTADAAHELRTPIAGLRTTLQVCRSRPRDAEAYQAAIDKSLAILELMQRLVENLLLLGRAEAGQAPAVNAPVELAELLRETWSSFAARAASENVALEWQAPASCLLQCDSDKLRIVLANLFDNAVSYVDAGGKVSLRLACSHDAVELQVTNTGSHVGPADLPHLVERFWRKDAARSQTGLHAGLGLSLCQRLLTLMGGRLQISSEMGGRFTVIVRLPATQP